MTANRCSSLNSPSRSARFPCEPALHSSGAGAQEKEKPTTLRGVDTQIGATPMTARNINEDRRMAAWLLTLPGPWVAISYEEALRHARTGLSPALSGDAFALLLHDSGFAITEIGAGLFECAPIDAGELAHAHLDQPATALIVDGRRLTHAELHPARPIG